jgi:hypothetical protein
MEPCCCRWIRPRPTHWRPASPTADTRPSPSGLMHAYANDIHECMVADALRRAAPDLAVSISSVVSPQMRELPRFNTVIANAYVQPLVSAYLGRLVAELLAAGSRAGLPDAFRRRARVGGNGHRPARAPAGIRPRRRRDLCRGRGAGAWAGQGAQLRHGRHHRQDLPDRGRRAQDRQHLRGRPHVPVQERLGDADLHPCGRDGRDRRGRWLHRLDRRHGPPARRPAIGGVGTRPRLLRTWRERPP